MSAAASSRTSRRRPASRWRAGSACPPRLPTSTTTATPDLYVTTVRGGNMLFENDGRGRFRDISAASGLGYVGHSSGGGVLRLRPRRPPRPLPRQRRTVHDRHARGRGQQVLRGVRGRVHRSPEAGTRRAEHPVPQRGRQPLRRRVQAHGARRRLLVRRRQRGRRQRRRLARPLRPQHAGPRRVLRERRRQELRAQEPPGVSPDLLGLDGHQGVRRQQRRPARHLHHRHALGHERDGRPRARAR